MRINTNEQRVLIDVDLTLIEPNTNGLGLLNYLTLNYYGKPLEFCPLIPHIDLLKSYKQRGYEVIVHSANGWQWAKEVVEKLGLTEFVDEVATKPLKYVDDKPADTWMHRVYLGE